MERGFAVRRYRPADRDPVWRVHDAALRDSAMEFSPEYNRYLRHVPAEFIETGGEFLVAAADPDPDAGSDAGDGRSVVGIGGYQPLSYLAGSGGADFPTEVGTVDSTARVRSVAVLPEHQSSGVGTELMAELETRAADAGFDHLILKTTESLVAARRFYESLDYRPAGEAAPDGSAETHLWYRKRL